jgi:hypothetical protein
VAKADTTDIEQGFAKLGLSLQLMSIFGDAIAEVHRARDLHGDQTDRALGMGPDEEFVLIANGGFDTYNGAAANIVRGHCQDMGDDATWADIVGEEFFEMLAESDPAKIETEAIQTIAMLANVILAARKQA